MSPSLPEHWPWTESPVCLVTGAARGLGRAVAAELARRGAAVYLTGRDADGLQAAAAELAGGGDIRPLTADVTDIASVRAAAAAIDADAGRLDLLINNAAAYVDWTETALGADLGASRRVMETNLYGAWTMLQAFHPLLLRSVHPRVVNMASGAGSHGDLQFGLATRGGSAASYGVSKAALLALTTTIATELASTPVMVNAVDPYLTATWPGAEHMGARPTSDSIPGILWAATLPDDGPRGGFFRDGHPLDW